MEEHCRDCQHFIVLNSASTALYDVMGKHTYKCEKLNVYEDVGIQPTFHCNNFNMRTPPNEVTKDTINNHAK